MRIYSRKETETQTKIQKQKQTQTDKDSQDILGQTNSRAEACVHSCPDTDRDIQRQTRTDRDTQTQPRTDIWMHACPGTHKDRLTERTETDKGRQNRQRQTKQKNKHIADICMHACNKCVRASPKQTQTDRVRQKLTDTNRADKDTQTADVPGHTRTDKQQRRGMCACMPRNRRMHVRSYLGMHEHTHIHIYTYACAHEHRI